MPSPPTYDLRKNRSISGPIFTPRTGTERTDLSHNLGKRTGSGNTIGGIPIPTGGGRTTGRGSLSHQVQRLESYRTGDLRHGYYHRDRGWRDWHFGYGYYMFFPVPWDCVFSPYYWYWSVPGYFHYHRVWYHRPRIIILFGGHIPWTYCGRGYSFYYTTYSQYSNYSSYNALDRALSDLVDAFKYSDATLLDKFLPRDSEVAIYIDGTYSYTMKSDDYYDVTADLIYSVYTTNFEIVQVQRARSGEYRIAARHDYKDVWNAQQTSWLTFTLERRGSSYVITEAGTSRFQPYL